MREAGKLQRLDPLLDLLVEVCNGLFSRWAILVDQDDAFRPLLLVSVSSFGVDNGGLDRLGVLFLVKRSDLLLGLSRSGFLPRRVLDSGLHRVLGCLEHALHALG